VHGNSLRALHAWRRIVHESPRFDPIPMATKRGAELARSVINSHHSNLDVASPIACEALSGR